MEVCPEIDCEELRREESEDDDVDIAGVVDGVDSVDVENIVTIEVLVGESDGVEEAAFDPVMWKGKLYENTDVSLLRVIIKP